METVYDLHESTEYKVRGSDGESDRCRPARGLREGCSTSPILFNVFSLGGNEAGGGGT